VALAGRSAAIAGGAAEAEPTPAPAPSPAPDCLARPLEAAERDTLLRLAWRTLSGHLTDQPIRDADLEAYSFTPCLLAPRGLFVTLKKGDQVRGLQGEIEATRPLYQQVIVFTRRAATRDPRFLPLAEGDLGGLTVDLSIIGERHKVGGPGDIHLETEGVFLEKWGRRALFLPGIASRLGWTPERTLDDLCSQAALPKGSWSESARLEVFTTEEVAGGPPVDSSPAPSPAPSPEPSGTPAATPPPGRS
jgi:AmmeMemoRadiSam system protein A